MTPTARTEAVTGPARTVITGSPVFTADPSNPWAEAIVVVGPDIAYVGSREDAIEFAGTDAVVVETTDGLIMPGFVDGHVHVAMTGADLSTLQLRDATELQEIQRRVKQEADENPAAERIVANSWLHSAIPGARPTKAMIDEFVPDRPVYLIAYDLHSSWVNTAGLAELGITKDTPDPVGGEIVRDEHGEPTGWLLESAHSTTVWPLLADVPDDVIKARIVAAMSAYARAGVTSVVEMALDAQTLALMAELRDDGKLTTRIVAHMIVPRTESLDDDLQVVERAVALKEKHDGDRLRVAGIKIVSDGTIDGCTAALREPYTNGTHGDPIWDAESLNAVVGAADRAGLQVAIHAIGDLAIGLAIDALELAATTNRTSGARHRIEHLEFATEEDIARLGPLGITASMQPVHTDPAIMGNWMAMIGEERGSRGWAWPLYLAAGATLAFGTDTPTAPLEALPNMYIGATRKSPTDPSLLPHRPEWALPLEQTLVHGTRESAFAAWLETSTGMLKSGLSADVVVLTRNPLSEGPQILLETDIAMTMSRGDVIYES